MTATSTDMSSFLSFRSGVESHSEVNDVDKLSKASFNSTRVEMKPNNGVSDQASEPKPGHGKNNHHLHLKEFDVARS